MSEQPTGEPRDAASDPSGVAEGARDGDLGVMGLQEARGDEAAQEASVPDSAVE